MTQHLDQNELAARWRVSPRTLEQRRWQGRGPRYLKINGRVIYPIPEVEAVEAASLHAKTFVFDRQIGFIGSYNLDPR